jgi:membrane-bound lytic murein transglycosylase MltF
MLITGRRRTACGGVLLLATMGLCACSQRSAPSTAEPGAQTVAPVQAPQDATPAMPPGEAAPVADDERLGISNALLSRRWTGDFDGMVERRLVRILAPYSRTFYFVDKGEPRGIAHDIAVLLEKSLNEQLKTSSANRVFVVVIPTSRDALYDALIQGRGDVIVAGVTVTPERAKLVDFTRPTKKQVRQIVVTGPGAPALATLDDLAGREVTVRDKSIQLESLQQLNATFRRQGKAAVRIRTVPTLLEDEDILEMTNAGLLHTVVVDDHYAAFWEQVLPDITPHPAIVVRDQGALAWALRKNSPQLVARLDPFIEANGEGTLTGNVLLRKYLEDTSSVRGATSEAQIRRFHELVELFRKYGDKYSVDYLLMMAQGYQESQLDQSVRSPVGAVGVMQVMPATGKELDVGDIRQVDPNVEAGVKYMRFMIDRYYKDEPMDGLNKVLFTFASYNAGPARIRQLRRQAAERGLDPNVWFNNVERVVAEKIGRETVTYVSNIYKYYVAYTLVMQEREEKQKALSATTETR